MKDNPFTVQQSARFDLGEMKRDTRDTKCDDDAYC